MENATKALLMAAGILIGILLLSLMVSLFLSSKNVSSQYESTKQSEAVRQFNANFTKYLGKDYLTAYDIVTIYNFADYNNVTVTGVSGIGVSKIKTDIDSNNVTKYKLEIVNYSNEGYITKIRLYAN